MVNQNVEYQPGHVIDYKAKINLFIEMEKLKLLTKAMAAGIAESDVLTILDEENLIDFDVKHL